LRRSPPGKQGAPPPVLNESVKMTKFILFVPWASVNGGRSLACCTFLEDEKDALKKMWSTEGFSSIGSGQDDAVY
jgi:hypothetical protein